MLSTEYVVGIGACNLDITGVAENNITLYDSNEGKVRIFQGGVCRNVCENLSRLAISTKLITVVGNDDFGQQIIKKNLDFNIDMSYTFQLSDANTSFFLSIAENNGEMKVALADTNILDYLDIQKIKLRNNIIENASIIIMDSNIRQDVLEYVLRTYKHKLIFVDTVSAGKATKLKNCLRYIDTLKTTLDEIQGLCGFNIRSKANLRKAASMLIEQGIKHLFVTLQQKDVYYMGINTNGKYFKALSEELIYPNGFEDAFMAGLIYSRMKNMTLNNTVKFSTALARLTWDSETNVNTNLTLRRVQDKMEGV